MGRLGIMRIIKQGTKLSERKGTFECRVCASEIEATVGEAFDRGTSYQGDYLYFECPVCKAHVGIETKQFLANVRKL